MRKVKRAEGPRVPPRSGVAKGDSTGCRHAGHWTTVRHPYGTCLSPVPFDNAFERCSTHELTCWPKSQCPRLSNKAVEPQ